MTTIKLEEIRPDIIGIAEQHGLSPRDTNILQLLAEEMISMTETLLAEKESSFRVEYKDNSFWLCLSAQAQERVGVEEKHAFISLSPTGKNASVVGLKAKILSVLDDLLNTLYPYNCVPMTDAYMFNSGVDVYPLTWSMNSYINAAPSAEQTQDWDGLEKSIIINFADDVIIGVNHNTVDMVVKKSF